MNALSIEQEMLEGGNLCLKVGGSLDRSGVYELRDRILGLKSREVTLDFSGLGGTDDLALSVLAMWLADHHQKDMKVHLVGLSPHARNVVMSFGVNTAV